MEELQAIFTAPETGPGGDACPSPPGPGVVERARPELYAAGRARCPRCRIEYLYDPVRYPWCPGCAGRPGKPDEGHPG